MLTNPFRKIDSSASFERHVLSSGYHLGEPAMEIAIAAIRIVGFGGTPTAARVGAFPGLRVEL